MISDSYSIDWKAYPTRTYTWAGDGILRPSERQAIRVLHDVAHCALSSPTRRTLPEWGLGNDPASLGGGLIYADMTVSDLFAQQEEDTACDLTWVLAAYYGGQQAASCVQSDLHMEGALSASRVKALRKQRRLQFLPSYIWDGALALVERGV